MRNFYYVLSFNLTNQKIKTMLYNKKMSNITDSMVDFKLRSKLFFSYTDALSAATDDCHNKLDDIYEDKSEHNISVFSISNPSLMDPNSQIEDFLHNTHIKAWDENCASVLFFSDNKDEPSEVNINLNELMLKYEIFFSEDAMELPGNGDFIFMMNSHQLNAKSTYH